VDVSYEELSDSTSENTKMEEKKKEKKENKGESREIKKTPTMLVHKGKRRLELGRIQKKKKPRTRPTVPKTVVSNTSKTKDSIPNNSRIALLEEKLKDHSKDVWKEIKGNQQELFK